MVRQVLRHHLGLVWRTPFILYEASKGWTAFTTVLFFYLLFNKKIAAWGYGVIGTVSPWWALVPVGLLFLYGLMQANYEKYQQAVAGATLDASRLRAYESHDTSNVVSVLASGEPTHMVAPERDAEGYTECLVPYDPEYVGLPYSGTTITVGTLGGTYYITLGHEALSLRDSPRPVAPIRVETLLHVVRYADQGEQVVRRLTVYSGEGELAENKPFQWWYTVSCTTTLSDLPEGEYGFEVHDRTNAPGTGIIYRNRHLTVSKLDEG